MDAFGHPGNMAKTARREYTRIYEFSSANNIRDRHACGKLRRLQRSDWAFSCLIHVRGASNSQRGCETASAAISQQLSGNETSQPHSELVGFTHAAYRSTLSASRAVDLEIQSMFYR